MTKSLCQNCVKDVIMAMDININQAKRVRGKRYNTYLRERNPVDFAPASSKRLLLRPLSEENHHDDETSNIEQTNSSLDLEYTGKLSIIQCQ